MSLWLEQWWHSPFLNNMRQIFITLSPIPKASNNQILQNGRQACTDVSQQMRMHSLPLGQVKNIYDFVSTFIWPVRTQIDRIVDHHALTLHCSNVCATTNDCVFICNSISSPTNTIGKIVQHAPALPSKWWRSHYYRIMWLRDRNLVLTHWGDFIINYWLM